MQSLILLPGIDDTMGGSIDSYSLLVNTSQFGGFTHNEEVI